MLIDEILTEFKEYSEKKKNQKKPHVLNPLENDDLLKLLRFVNPKIKEIYQTNKESFFELIGQMVEIDANLGFYIFSDWGDDENTTFLVEKTMMERYFLMNGEKFLKGPFWAWVYIKGRKLAADVRLTSHRLLIRGTFIKSPNIFGIGSGLSRLVTLAIESSIRAAVRKAAEKKIQSFEEPNSERLNECKFIQIPTLNPRNIKKTKTSFSFNTTIDIQKKNKLKSINLSIKIELGWKDKRRREEMLQYLKETIVNTRLLELLKK